MKKPELLAPAGSLDILKMAITYGADAVYLGGVSYGLRANAKNFTMEDLKEGIHFAHERGKRIYVTVNILAHNDDLPGIDEYLKELERIGVDAIIIADPGIFMIANEVVPNLEKHISTQTSVCNYKAFEFWKKQGAARIVPAREVSIKDLKTIKEKVEGVEIEAFIHGAMCISYSGRCLLSNYFTGRDANRGNCAQACRWKYNIVEETRPGVYMPVMEDEKGTYIFNSKDLCMIEHLDDLIEAGVDSFKVEGRMKTEFYVANIIRAYRKAIDDYFIFKETYLSNKAFYLDMLKKASYRDFTTGFFYGKPQEDGQNYDSAAYIRGYDYCALILGYDREKKMARVMQKNKFVLGEELEIMKKDCNDASFKLEYMENEAGERVSEAPHPEEILYVKVEEEVSLYDMLRKKALD